MKRRKGYIVEMLERGAWTPTWWTNDFPPDDDGTPAAVDMAKARRRLAFASEFFPETKYRITEVAK